MSPAEYRAHREKLGLTQAQLAQVLGLPRTAIVKREANRQRITIEAEMAMRSLLLADKRKPKISVSG